MKKKKKKNVRNGKRVGREKEGMEGEGERRRDSVARRCLDDKDPTAHTHTQTGRSVQYTVRSAVQLYKKGIRG